MAFELERMNRAALGSIEGNPIRVKTDREDALLWLTVALLFVSLAGLCFPGGLPRFVSQHPFRRYLYYAWPFVNCGASTLLLIAARKYRKARRGADPKSVAQAIANGNSSSVVVGTRVRLRANLTEQEKASGPGWGRAMDKLVGMPTKIARIDSHGRGVLDAAPHARVELSWLQPLD